ncbi:MAG: hypothetical protein NTZ05_17900 [Chloroflexi bacterium]|nr:hypothetical protein [Chloroflexota bacterium]
MTMRLLAPLLALFVALTAGLLPLSGVSAATDGVIAGALAPNTPGGPGISGIEIRLFIFKGEQEQAQRTGTTDTQGGFRFEGLDTSKDYTYQVAALYAGLPYGTSGLRFDEGQTEKTVKVDVFDVTGDNPGLYADSASFMLIGADPETESAFALEIVEIVNPSSKAFQPGIGAGSNAAQPMNPANLVRFALPPGATDLTPHIGITDEEIVQIDRGFSSLAVILPGTHEFMYAYRFPYKDGKVEFAKSLLYGAKKFTLLTLDGTGELAAPEGLTAGETVELRGQKFRQWGGHDLPPGSSVQLRYKNLPQPSGIRMPTVMREQPVVAYSILGVGGGMMGLSLLLLMRARMEKRAALLPAEAAASTAGDGEIDGYLAALADLDDRFAAGQVAPAAYETDREALKRDLKDLLRERDLRLTPVGGGREGE